MIDVRMADGRTTFRFWSRGQFISLLKRKPEEIDKERYVNGFARWHTDDENPWEPVKLTYIRPNSISFVRVVPSQEREAFEAAYGSTPAPPADPTRIPDTA